MCCYVFLTWIGVITYYLTFYFVIPGKIFFCFKILISIWHTSSMERFSGNFDENAETCLIFFLAMHWFQKCNFWKNSLSPFWGRWCHRGQTTLKPQTTKILNENVWKLDEIQNLASATSKMISWPQQLRKGLSDFFKNYIFKIRASSWEKWAITFINTCF